MKTTTAFSAAVFVASALISVNIPAPEPVQDRNVIVVAVDGMGWQDVFGAGRDTLMPFLWRVVAKEGRLLGNRSIGSRMRVTNKLNFSYPGYQEMLAGYVDSRIDNNHYGPNRNVTVLEWLNRHLDLHGRVAAFANWKVFADILAVRDSSLLVRAGGERGEEVIDDAIIHREALRYLTLRKPRVLFVGYGETDAWAHRGDRARYLSSARDADRFIGELWRAAQAMPEYQGRTTLIVTTDHGRGRGRHWSSHGWRTRGSGETWLAIVGPDVRAIGEERDSDNTTSQVAATIAAALGLDYRAAVPRAAPALVH